MRGPGTASEGCRGRTTAATKGEGLIGFCPRGDTQPKFEGTSHRPETIISALRTLNPALKQQGSIEFRPA